MLLRMFWRSLDAARCCSTVSCSWLLSAVSSSLRDCNSSFDVSNSSLVDWYSSLAAMASSLIAFWSSLAISRSRMALCRSSRVAASSCSSWATRDASAANSNGLTGLSLGVGSSTKLTRPGPVASQDGTQSCNYRDAHSPPLVGIGRFRVAALRLAPLHPSSRGDPGPHHRGDFGARSGQIVTSSVRLVDCT